MNWLAGWLARPIDLAACNYPLERAADRPTDQASFGQTNSELADLSALSGILRYADFFPNFCGGFFTTRPSVRSFVPPASDAMLLRGG